MFHSSSMAPNHPLDPAGAPDGPGGARGNAWQWSNHLRGTPRDSGHDTAENGGFAAVEHVGKCWKTTILDQKKIISKSPFWGLKYIKFANMICKKDDLKETIWVLKYGLRWSVKWRSSIIDHPLIHWMWEIHGNSCIAEAHERLRVVEASMVGASAACAANFCARKNPKAKDQEDNQH